MYVPKNKIKTNQYTSGGDLEYLSNGEIYIGFYWQTYDGKFFTGKNPNDGTSQELVLSSKTNQIWEKEPIGGNARFTQLVENYDGETYSGNFQNMGDITIYNKIKKVNINQSRNLPYQFYPKPTQSDYDLGTFTRYFCVKTNENIYLEISEEVYNKLTSRDSNWKWETYIAFQLPWTLIGEKDTVYLANRNSVLITEQRLNRKGLQIFLKENYLKFWNP